MTRVARKVDANHAAIVQALRGVGAAVLDLSGVGGGCPDLLVEYQGKVTLMEVKNPSGRNRVDPRQVAWAQAWRGQPPVVVRSVDEALAAVGVIAAALAARGGEGEIT